MDPSSKGWLNKYLSLRQNSLNVEEINSEQDLYKYLQPTGIIYGHPIKLPEGIDVNTENLPIKERMKIILAEAFISCGIVNINPELDNEEQFERLKKIFGGKNENFYKKLKPEIQYKTLSFWKKLQGIELAEYYLDKRIVVKAHWNSNFFQGFFHNILLFTDIVQFSNWLRKNSDEDSLVENRESLRLMALQIIAVSAYADDKIEKSEKKLFDYFIESCDLNKQSRKEANKFILNKITLDNIDFNRFDSWLLRKYFLELSILTLWADRDLSDKEIEFLSHLSSKLKLDDDELQSSLIGVESFVIDNWDKVHYLQKKQNYIVLSDRIVKRFAKIAGRYKNQIKNEIHESKELVELLSKSRSQHLSIEEKEKVRHQLIDVLKTIPALIIVTMPFTFLTLPILFKILPKSVFPSSFDENKLMKRSKNRIIG